MKGLPRSLSRGSKGVAPVVRQLVKIVNKTFQVDGATGVGWGTVVIGDLPQGNILFLGAAAYLKFSKGTGATGVQDTFDGDYSVGSAPTADATLNGSEVDIIPSTALGAATGGVSPNARGVNATQVMLDNTDNSLELNLNLLIDDTNVSADDQNMVANGLVELRYAVLLDD